MRSYKIIEYDKKRNHLIVELKSESGIRVRRFDANFLDPESLDEFFADHLRDYEKHLVKEENFDVSNLVGKSVSLDTPE